MADFFRTGYFSLVYPGSRNYYPWHGFSLDVRFVKRGIYSPTTDSFKLGYRMKNGVEADGSWSSSLLSVSAMV